MSGQIFEHDGFSIEYSSSGEGETAVVAFHGFGRSARDYAAWPEALSGGRRWISVNLFAHGQSRLPEGRLATDSLGLNEHQALFHAFLEHLGIERFILVGYSMGARVALVVYDQFHPQVDGLLLMAPDGMKRNWLADFSTETLVGRMVHRSVLKQPALLLRPTNAARHLRLINKKMHRFVHVHMDTETSRRQVYEAWHIYKHFKPHRQRIAKRLDESGMPFRMIFGRFDSVIPLHLGEKFDALLQRSDALVALETGHLLMEDALEFICKEKELFDW